MPTARPRHQITETDAVARALDLAARRWPGESRGRLLLRLVDAGLATLEDERAGVRARRLAAIEATSGAFDDCFPDDYLASLRDDWPE